MNKRFLEIDFLRACFVISAIVLHYSNNYALGYFSYPSKFIQNTTCSVGIFFFFTAGYISRKYYVQKFLQQPQKTTSKLFWKSAQILLIFILYVAFMCIATGIDFPNTFFEFMFRRGFGTRILFAFSFLYFIQPIILLLFVKNKKLFILFVGLIYLIYYFKTFNFHPLTHEVKDYFSGIFIGLGEKEITYPIFPTGIGFLIGFILSDIEELNKKLLHIHKKRIASASIIILYTHITLVITSLFIFKDLPYLTFIRKDFVWVLISPIFAYLIIFCFRYFASFKFFFKLFLREEFLLIGTKSLTFYVISNMLNSLISIPVKENIGYNFLGFIGIFILTYLFTFWHYKSDLFHRQRSQDLRQSKLPDNS